MKLAPRSSPPRTTPAPCTTRPAWTCKLLSHVSQHGGVGGFTGGQAMDKNEFWTLETEFLIPAALESQITAANAAKVRAKIVVEGANGPTTPEADDILFEHGVYVVPDVLANAGGVTVSYFEWVQDFSSFFWSEDEINQRLERIMREAYAGVSQVAREHRSRCAPPPSSWRARGSCKPVRCAACIRDTELAGRRQARRGRKTIRNRPQGDFHWRALASVRPPRHGSVGRRVAGRRDQDPAAARA